MPNHAIKSAAVTFVNQKGERSMKRVKVERYVAGKKPAYAEGEDEDEYYTTDDEMDNEEEENDDEEANEEDEEEEVKKEADDKRRVPVQSFREEELDLDASDSDEEEDPRFKALKRVAGSSSDKLLSAQTGPQATTSWQRSGEEKNIIIDEDEEEDEEEIRTRQALARTRKIDDPIGPQIALDEFADQQLALKQAEFEQNQAKKEETDDILKDLKVTFVKPKKNKRDSAKTDEQLKEMIEKAREQAIITSQLHKKIEEDNKRELEKEAADKGDIGSYEMEMVKTDDEDEDLAYEEWKLREIKRVLRDRSERVFEQAKAR